MDDCTHVPAVARWAPPTSEGCEDCLAMGATWVHLRLCVACGHVGCCDQSVHHHARAHHDSHSGHVLIRSLEPDEAWWYCWEDDVAFELEGIGPLPT